MAITTWLSAPVLSGAAHCRCDLCQRISGQHGHAVTSSAVLVRKHAHAPHSSPFEGIGWLRAAVLGANDGIVSTASLIVGVASSAASSRAISIAGVSALVAGSMAAGEYVSVSSQSDTERADLSRERQELREDPASELEELTGIYLCQARA